MIRSNIKYWYFKSVIPNYICDQIIKLGNSLKENKAIVGEPKIEGTKLKVRDSDVSWINDKWVLKEIIPYIGIANIDAKWFVEMDNHELAQFTKYKLNQHYDWHFDQYLTPDEFGKTRKLSLILSLSDSSEYEGGKLLFDYQDYPNQNKFSECTELKNKGSIIVFPSYLYHKVTPVTEGTRYSLVIWAKGNNWR